MMDPRIILYFVIIVLPLLLHFSPIGKERKKGIYVGTVILLLILESTLRGLEVGPDTIDYYHKYLQIQQSSWRELWGGFSTYFNNEGKDPGFPVFVKTIQLISDSFQFFLFVSACLYFIPLGIIIKKYSSNLLHILFAFTLYVSLFHIITLSGIRQQIALGLSFVAFELFVKRRYFGYGIVILLGAFIHVSILICLLIPLISLFKQRIRIVHLVSILLIPVVLNSSRVLIGFFASLTANEYYMAYAETDYVGGATTYVTMMELLSLICFIFSYKDSQKDGLSYPLLANLPLVTCFVPLTMLSPTFIRIGEYFTVFMMILFPKALDRLFEKKLSIFAYSMVCLFLIIMSFKTHFNYSFFWQ